MSRRKSVPTKRNNSHNDYTSDDPLDYIPVKRRKGKRKGHLASTIFHQLIQSNVENKQFHVGEICVGTTDNVLPETWSSCKAGFIYCQEKEEWDMVLNLDSTTVIVKLLMEYEMTKDIITSKIFAIDVFTANEVYLDVYFINLPLPKFSAKLGYSIQRMFSLLYGIPIETHQDEIECDQSSDQAIAQLYKNVKAITLNKSGINIKVEHHKLGLHLRPYQEDAVSWMLQKEQQICETLGNLHPLYTPVQLKSGINIYFDKYSGYVELVKPTVGEPIKGGILADEMGLGKTVEVLACILLHQSPLEQANQDNIKGTPTVTKTRKPKMRESKVQEGTLNQAKALKVPEDWVKSSSKKSQSRLALEMWYDSCLSDVQKAPTSYCQPVVQCICGNTDEDDTISCEDCSRVQHSSCVGFHKKFGVFLCSQCWMNRPLLECGATLIVAPISLRTQWCNEICKHVRGDFKVLLYEGSSAVYPVALLKYNVVITTYNVLQAELRLTEQEKYLSFRHQKRYLRPGCPLTRIKWWRLCLDEAQTVDTPTTMVSEMAKKLCAHFRWAVTGTPISKEISDLHGLINYLQMQPYSDKYTWDQLLFNPYCRGEAKPLQKFLSQVLWRSSKEDVIDQINIPKQTVKEHWLDFSAVEHYFYKREHNYNCNVFLERARKYDPHLPLQTLDKSCLKVFLAPLLSLRQICTFPNSVGTRYLATKKPMNSMKDLLEALISKNTNESEEYLRIILSSLNGLAGIYLLLEIPEQAVEEYRKVLQLYARFTKEERVAKMSVDKLLIIHALHNLAEVLEIFPDIGSKTLRDDNLRESCADLEKKYIEKFVQKSMTALQESSLITASVQKLQGSFMLEAGRWYSDLLDWLYVHGHIEDLYNRIDGAHEAIRIEPTIRFRNKKMLYAIVIWDQQISSLRDNLLTAVSDLYCHNPEDKLKVMVDQGLVEKATDCHLRPQKKCKVKKRCPVCVSNDHLKTYESTLFSMSKRAKYFEEMSLKGSWKPTTEELIFRSILAVGRMKNADINLIKDGEVHMTILETLKKEFKEVRKLWTYLDQQICVQDELDMCKTRLRLKETDEHKQAKVVQPILKNLSYIMENKLETIHVLNAHELEYQRTGLHNEEMRNMESLEKNVGIRNYLETLHNQHYEGHSPDPCPICKNTLEQEWSILPCGHSYCLECIQFLVKQTRGKGDVQCSVCRVHHLIQEISYVKLGEQKSHRENIEIRGQYSTKVESMIRLILDLRAEDENVKVLLFSSWVSVLVYIRTALVNNDIVTELVTSTKLEKQIEHFKDPNGKVTVLLLPVQLGSKGLNLIEATHVILTEPLVNPGDELQAVGRVHRIGQSRPTVVHKFFIKNTIEESIHRMVSADAQSWDKKKVTINQLMDLFVTNESDESVAETTVHSV